MPNGLWPDHEQFHLEIGRKHEHAAHRMSATTWVFSFTCFFRHRAGALENV